MCRVENMLKSVFSCTVARFSMVFFWVVFLVLCCTPSVYAQPVFVTPIEGVAQRDFFIVNYVDHDTTDSVRDYHCGVQTYNGHKGTDFVLRSFAQMDSGTAVLAAARGKVVSVIDSLYDRSKRKNDSGYGNYILVLHADGYYAYYAHIRKHSAMVRVGDSVQAGERIALVGSSGNSTDPHLHFEVWQHLGNDKYVNIDPFTGPCSEPQSLWAEQLLYDTAFGIIDYGMLSWPPTLDTLRERPPSAMRFTENDTAVYFWTHNYGIRAGDTAVYVWYMPNGTLWFADTVLHIQQWRYAYWWSWIYRPPLEHAGQWRAVYRINGGVKAVYQFVVQAATSVRMAEMNTRNSSVQVRTGMDRGSTTLQIVGPHGSTPRSVALYDMQGRMCLYYGKHLIAGSNNTVVVPLPSGVYIVYVQMQNYTIGRVVYLP